MLMHTNPTPYADINEPGHPQGDAPTLHERASHAAPCIVGGALAAPLAPCGRSGP